MLGCKRADTNTPGTPHRRNPTFYCCRGIVQKHLQTYFLAWAVEGVGFRVRQTGLGFAEIQVPFFGTYEAGLDDAFWRVSLATCFGNAQTRSVMENVKADCLDSRERPQ